MLTAALTMSLLLSQNAPAVGVTISSKRPGTDEYPKKVADYVHALLKLEEMSATNDSDTRAALKKVQAADPRNCQGATLCLMKLAGMLGPEAVIIGVDVGKVQTQLALHLEAVSGNALESLAIADIVVESKNWSEQASSSLTEFVRQLKTKMRAKQNPPSESVATDVPKEAKPRDIPTSVSLTPTSTGTDNELVTSGSSPSGSKVLPWALVGGAAVSAGAAVTFGILGGQDARKYNSALVNTDQGQGTTLSKPEADALAASANTKIGLAIGTAVLSAGLGGLATYFFVKE
jgi:hypothetical protein